jgi:glycosyltransferase involved in cell wall biosynthesis
MKDLPSNIKIWGERNDVEIFLTAADIFMFNSTWECNPLVLREAISYGLPTLSRNLPQYMDMFTKYIHPIDDNINKTKETLLSINDQVPTNYRPSTDQVKLFAEQHINLYNKIMNEEFNKQKMMDSEIQIFQHFVNNPFLEIKGNTDKIYKVEFFDNNGVNRYTNEIGVNNWIKLNRSSCIILKSISTLE